MDLVPYNNLNSETSPDRTTGVLNENLLDIGIIVLLVLLMFKIIYTSHMLIRRQLINRRPVLMNRVESPVVLRRPTLRR